MYANFKLFYGWVASFSFVVCGLSCICCSLLETGTGGITGLRLKTFKENWSSDYQFTTNAGIPDPEGPIYWNFK